MALLARYLDEIGAGVAVPKPDAEAPKSLPVFLSQLYEVHRADLFEREYSLRLCRGQDRPTPAQIEKHLKVARSILGGNVAFVFLTLPAFDRLSLYLSLQDDPDERTQAALAELLILQQDFSYCVFEAGSAY
jgi:hypothetical protein